jgi:hypothetical protein
MPGILSDELLLKIIQLQVLLFIFHQKELHLVSLLLLTTCHKYPLARFHMKQSSAGVIDSIHQSASAADLLSGNISAVDKILNTYLIVRLQIQCRILLSAQCCIVSFMHILLMLKILSLLENT